MDNTKLAQKIIKHIYCHIKDNERLTFYTIKKILDESTQDVYKCLICGTKLDKITIVEDDPSNDISLWDGSANNFVCGYGSKHDNTEFLICLCDDCISSKIEEGLLYGT